MMVFNVKQNGIIPNTSTQIRENSINDIYRSNVDFHLGILQLTCFFRN